MSVSIEPSWASALQQEFPKPYFKQLVDFIKAEKARGKVIYPAGPKIFNAFAFCPFHKVKVVILGQDPYHGPGQAMGLSFSVPKTAALPPSLQNIYKELEQDLGIPRASHGDLTSWAEQGVLLLNASLTVEHARPNSHATFGWHCFTDAVIRAISAGTEHVVFLLWGKFAGTKAALIDQSKHLVLVAPHPSPFSADRGFFGCKHFSRANGYLQDNERQPINWQLPQ